MSTASSIFDKQILRRVTASLGLFALVASVISLTGWACDIPRFTSWIDGDISIQPNTCVLIAVASIAILLLHYGHHRATLVLGGFVAAGGGLNLLQYALGADFGFNHQLLFGREWGHTATMTPGRFGPPASISFVLIGFALMFLVSQMRRCYVPMLALVVVLLMMFSLLGYIFDARNFYAIPWLSAIALPAAIMLMALALSLILSVPEQHPMLLLCERSSAGTMARTVLPILVLMVPLFIWLRSKGYEMGLFDLGTSRALGAAMLMLGMMLLMWIALLALRRREQREREADRRKDEFLATLAHELRNPLAPISNAVSLLKLGGDDPDAFTRATNTIERQTAHLVRLVDDLLDMSRISRGKIELRRCRVELATVIQQAVETCTPMAQSEGQTITLVMPPQPVFVEADSVRLTQVVNNLLNNACKFAGKGGQISLITELRDQQIVITVKDNGIGIPPHMLAFIFEMFSQVDQSLERSQSGLGIGLTLAKQLVELHDGKIEVRSEGLGKGSEFIVSLPLALDQTQPQLQATSQPVASGVEVSSRILIVDDNLDSAKSLFEVLTLVGNQVFIAHDGEEAIEAAERLRPDAILLDIGLPKLNGFEACKRIRENAWAKDTFIIALTGWGQDEDRHKSAQAGFDVHMVKPVDLTELLNMLSHPPQRDAAAG
jgi:signal transduction histidine kinase/ActR/RegA family two-component response regulator